MKLFNLKSNYLIVFFSHLFLFIVIIIIINVIAIIIPFADCQLVTWLGMIMQLLWYHEYMGWLDIYDIHDIVYSINISG